MSDMITRVAKAICKSRTCEGFMCCQNPAQMGRLHCPVEAGGYTDAARAAIEAMQIPDEAMMMAGYDATRQEDGSPQFAETGFCVGHAGRIFFAMIDAALSQDTHSLPSEDR